jgi:phage/plasmid-associated DNA primase
MTTKCARCVTLARVLNEILANTAHEEVDDRTLHHPRDIADFINARCVTGPGRRETFQGLYRSYTRWCQENNLIPTGSRRFGNALELQGYFGFRGTGGLGLRAGVQVRDQ